MMSPSTIEAFHELEEMEPRAVLEGDVHAIESFWSPDLLVNGPHNRLLIGRDATLDMVRERVIDFERFDRSVERVEFEGDVAVSMGSETVLQRRGAAGRSADPTTIYECLAPIRRTMAAAVQARECRAAAASDPESTS